MMSSALFRLFIVLISLCVASNVCAGELSIDQLVPDPLGVIAFYRQFVKVTVTDGPNPFMDSFPDLNWWTNVTLTLMQDLNENPQTSGQCKKDLKLSYGGLMNQEPWAITSKSYLLRFLELSE